VLIFFSDEDSSRMEDEVQSQMIGQLSLSQARTENVSRHSPAASLRASATKTSQRSMGVKMEPSEEVRELSYFVNSLHLLFSQGE